MVTQELRISLRFDRLVGAIRRVALRNSLIAALRPIGRTAYQAVLVPLVLLPAADAHQHAEDVVGVAALDLAGILAKALRPDLHRADHGAADGAGAFCGMTSSTVGTSPALR